MLLDHIEGGIFSNKDFQVEIPNPRSMAINITVWYYWLWLMMMSVAMVKSIHGFASWTFYPSWLSSLVIGGTAIIDFVSGLY
jgi:hypothetical protein